MYPAERVARELEALPNLTIRRNEPLRAHTRFGLGGTADILADAYSETAFLEVLRTCEQAGLACEIIGGGSNLVVADGGVAGVVLRYRGADIAASKGQVCAGAGVVLQDLVDFTIDRGLGGLHTLTGIPGWVGGAVYGNAGAYGRSMHQNVTRVRAFDGHSITEMVNAECQFHYRESIFKKRKDWIVFSATFELQDADGLELRRQADEILAVRNAKYPPELKCAGSIFKNLLFGELSPTVQQQVDGKVIREGKVPSAYFLEKAGAKGLREGGIFVADYHANLIVNDGTGTAKQVQTLISELKARVARQFGLVIEEEVQYLGFEVPVSGR